MAQPDASYHQTVNALNQDPEQLEQLYQTARQAGQTAAFKQAIDAGHAAAPTNLLYAAWFYRLQGVAGQAKEFAIAWAWAIPLALLNGLLFWLLSGDRFMLAIESFQGPSNDFLPVLLLLAAPLAAIFVLAYLTAAGRHYWQLAVFAAIFLLTATAYALLIYPRLGIRPFQEQYLTLMIMHLPLLAWAVVGLFALMGHRDPANRFSFLIKSLEAFIVGGLFVIAGGLFTAITIGLFQALGIDFSDPVQWLFLAGGGGLIPVLAVAISYNPAKPPAEQAFDQGLSRLVALLLRVMLPLTLLVLFIYLLFIPFNFRAPFDNRDVLIVYNGMLFAVVALLVGATPVSLADISPRLGRWLRLALIAVAALALLVSVYALAAILYRTALDRLTPNRLTFIGWNIVNIGLLLLILILQLRPRDNRWLPNLYRAYSAGTVAYAVWTVLVILLIPWLFGINRDRAAIEALPLQVQEIIFTQNDPILLKCADSPHIYLLEDAEKRWIDSIDTFTGRGYVWDDVTLIPCRTLRQIPDGPPIPPNAGPPPPP